MTSVHSAPPRFHRIPAADALAWIDGACAALPPGPVALDAAAGRILATDMRAPAAVPGCPRAALDGYALASADVQGAGSYSPLPVRLAAPGTASLRPGEALAVASGDALPRGADGVLPLEHAERRGGRLLACADIAAGEHAAQAGEEGRPGDLLLPAGRRLRPQDLALLALFGLVEATVVGRPRVCVILARDPTRDALGPMLAALVARDGGEPALARAPDRESLEAALAAARADLILVAGGTGPGPGDHAAAALAARGELAAWGVALHPGDTAGLGRAGGRPVVLLPGGPLACLCAYDLLAGRAVRRLAGRSGDWPHRSLRLPLARKVSSSLGRLEICRVRIDADAAVPLAVADGRVLATACAADGFVPVPEQSEGWPAGTPVDVLLYD